MLTLVLRHEFLFIISGEILTAFRKCDKENKGTGNGTTVNNDVGKYVKEIEDLKKKLDNFEEKNNNFNKEKDSLEKQLEALQKGKLHRC